MACRAFSLLGVTLMNLHKTTKYPMIFICNCVLIFSTSVIIIFVNTVSALVMSYPTLIVTLMFISQSIEGLHLV